jgi:hypothetical protein
MPVTLESWSSTTAERRSIQAWGWASLGVYGPKTAARTASSAPIGLTHRGMSDPILAETLDRGVIIVNQWSTIR